MSTRTSITDNLHARGGNDFDAVTLRDAIAELDDLQTLESAALSDYRLFYSLEFPRTSHQHSLYCVSCPGAAAGTGAAADERLVVQHFVPEDSHSHVLLCHGYYDHVGLYGHVIDYLLHRGVAVVTFDQIGHGLSSGAPAYIDNFDRYVAATHSVYCTARERLASTEAWHWFGQSMGGSIVMEYLHHHPPPQGVCEIVLLAPLVRPYAWWINRWIFALVKLTVEQRPRRLANNAENPEFHALQEIDPLQARVLPVAWVQAMVDWYHRFERYPISELAPKVLQGDDDHTVDWRYNLKVFQRRYPNARHLRIANGRHHLANDSAVVRETMWTFLDDTCQW